MSGKHQNGPNKTKNEPQESHGEQDEHKTLKERKTVIGKFWSMIFRGGGESKKKAERPIVNEKMDTWQEKTKLRQSREKMSKQNVQVIDIPFEPGRQVSTIVIRPTKTGVKATISQYVSSEEQSKKLGNSSTDGFSKSTTAANTNRESVKTRKRKISGVTETDAVIEVEESFISATELYIRGELDHILGRHSFQKESLVFGDKKNGFRAGKKRKSKNTSGADDIPDQQLQENIRKLLNKLIFLDQDDESLFSFLEEDGTTRSNPVRRPSYHLQMETRLVSPEILKNVKPFKEYLSSRGTARSDESRNDVDVKREETDRQTRRQFELQIRKIRRPVSKNSGVVDEQRRPSISSNFQLTECQSRPSEMIVYKRNPRIWDLHEEMSEAGSMVHAKMEGSLESLEINSRTPDVGSKNLHEILSILNGRMSDESNPALDEMLEKIEDVDHRIRFKKNLGCFKREIEPQVHDGSNNSSHDLSITKTYEFIQVNGETQKKGKSSEKTVTMKLIQVEYGKSEAENAKQGNSLTLEPVTISSKRFYDHVTPEPPTGQSGKIHVVLHQQREETTRANLSRVVEVTFPTYEDLQVQDWATAEPAQEHWDMEVQTVTLIKNQCTSTKSLSCTNTSTDTSDLDQTEVTSPPDSLVVKVVEMSVANSSMKLDQEIVAAQDEKSGPGSTQSLDPAIRALEKVVYDLVVRSREDISLDKSESSDILQLAAENERYERSTSRGLPESLQRSMVARKCDLRPSEAGEILTIEDSASGAHVLVRQHTVTKYSKVDVRKESIDDDTVKVVPSERRIKGSEDNSASDNSRQNMFSRDELEMPDLEDGFYVLYKQGRQLGSHRGMRKNISSSVITIDDVKIMNQKMCEEGKLQKESKTSPVRHSRLPKPNFSAVPGNTKSDRRNPVEMKAGVCDIGSRFSSLNDGGSKGSEKQRPVTAHASKKRKKEERRPSTAPKDPYRDIDDERKRKLTIPEVRGSRRLEKKNDMLGASPKSSRDSSTSKLDGKKISSIMKDEKQKGEDADVLGKRSRKKGVVITVAKRKEEKSRKKEEKSGHDGMSLVVKLDKERSASAPEKTVASIKSSEDKSRRFQRESSLISHAKSSRSSSQDKKLQSPLKRSKLSQMVEPRSVYDVFWKKMGAPPPKENSSSLDPDDENSVKITDNGNREETPESQGTKRGKQTVKSEFVQTIEFGDAAKSEGSGPKVVQGSDGGSAGTRRGESCQIINLDKQFPRKTRLLVLQTPSPKFKYEIFDPAATDLDQQQEDRPPEMKSQGERGPSGQDEAVWRPGLPVWTFPADIEQSQSRRSIEGEPRSRSGSRSVQLVREMIHADVVPAARFLLGPNIDEPISDAVNMSKIFIKKINVQAVKKVVNKLKNTSGFCR